MAKALVVVESPAKAKTINKYLGRDYKVVASMGHIRDLPKSKLGVDVDNDFAEEYESIESRKKIIKELKDAAKDASDIYVATDPDREGEAIGWHLTQELKGKKRKIHRLTFNEITKKAVQDALDHPRAIDEKMVAAQRARRVLDRLVGYKISPLLWDKVRRGLSAGRVQSVALKLVCDREREIEAFVPEEYWNVFARLANASDARSDVEGREFDAKLLKKHGDTIKIENEEQSTAVLAELEGARWIVASVTTKERKRHAAPPFITSKLQQTARFPVKKTMMLAQQLYEGGIDIPGLTGGLITYMRTDSVRVADEALAAVREHIGTAFGGEFVPEKPNFFRSKADAQDAHEAIRPTSLQHDPEMVRPYLTPDQYSLYRLIWNRFVASQMPPATFDETTVDIAAGDYLFRVKGTVPKFAGWMATYGLVPGQSEKESEGRESTLERDEQRAGGGTPSSGALDVDDETPSGVLPPLAEGDVLDLRAIRSEQKFTQPPARFSEATLVKELEENGIGRPSTVRVDHRRAAGSRVRQQNRGTLQADGARTHDYRAADQEFRRHHRRRLHAVARGRPRQDRAGQDGLRADADRVLPEVQERPRARRQRNAGSQERDRDRRGVRQMRRADVETRRQVRSIHRLQRVSGLHQHA